MEPHFINHKISLFKTTWCFNENLISSSITKNMAIKKVIEQK